MEIGYWIESIGLSDRKRCKYGFSRSLKVKSMLSRTAGFIIVPKLEPEPSEEPADE
ncbi:hypothetical protein D3C71_1817220 [compost metagenome]